MAVVLTERAAVEIRRYLDERGQGIGIRIIVEPSECSGLAYRLVFADMLTEGDQVFESHGAKVIVDAKSLVPIDGTVIDYLVQGDDSGFAFQNPNVTNQCGCGESFYI